MTYETDRKCKRQCLLAGLFYFLCTCACCPGPWSLHKAFSVSGAAGLLTAAATLVVGQQALELVSFGRCGAAGLVTPWHVGALDWGSNLRPLHWQVGS